PLGERAQEALNVRRGQVAGMADDVLYGVVQDPYNTRGNVRTHSCALANRQQCTTSQRKGVPAQGRRGGGGWHTGGGSHERQVDHTMRRAGRGSIWAGLGGTRPRPRPRAGLNSATTSASGWTELGHGLGRARPRI